MKPLDFISTVKERVVENILKNYQEMLTSSSSTDDPIWKQIVPLFQSLNINEKNIFLEFVRLIEINTVSHVLGILDGTTTVFDDEFELTVNGEVLNGNLQDLFLELVEPK